MKKLDETDLRLCAFQAELFEESLQACACGSAVFIRRFMNSRVAARLDQGAFAIEPIDSESVFREIDGEYGPSTYGTEKFAPEELHWIGYLYRYWCCSTESASKRVFKLAGAREMRNLYFPYHSLDPAQAVDRILEAKGVAVNEDLVEKGVVILRRIKKEEEMPTP